jgi:chromosome transmission fidelity protein 1
MLLLQVCPYYGSRRAVPAVDVILAPYSSVLLPDARNSLGIELQGSVVVFDEAHNLLDAINGAHSTAVSGACGFLCRVKGENQRQLASGWHQAHCREGTAVVLLHGEVGLAVQAKLRHVLCCAAASTAPGAAYLQMVRLPHQHSVSRTFNRVHVLCVWRMR